MSDFNVNSPVHARRGFLSAAGALAATGLSACAGGPGRPETTASASPAEVQACQVFDKARQAGVSPDMALDMLKRGNARFVAGTTVHCDLRAQVRDTAGGQGDCINPPPRPVVAG
jgi:hypothetical protein